MLEPLELENLWNPGISGILEPPELLEPLELCYIIHFIYSLYPGMENILSMFSAGSFQVKHAVWSLLYLLWTGVLSVVKLYWFVRV